MWGIKEEQTYIHLYLSLVSPSVRTHSPHLSTCPPPVSIIPPVCLSACVSLRCSVFQEVESGGRGGLIAGPGHTLRSSPGNTQTHIRKHARTHTLKLTQTSHNILLFLLFIFYCSMYILYWGFILNIVGPEECIMAAGPMAFQCKYHPPHHPRSLFALHNL